MGTKKTRYTKEFIAEAIKLVTEQGYTQAEASASLGISSKNLSRWIKRASNQITGSQFKLKLSAEQEEIKITC